MRSLLIVAFLAAPTHAESNPTATIEIDHNRHFRSESTRAITAIIDGTSHTVAFGETKKIEVRARVVRIEVVVPGGHKFHRWGALVAGASYKLAANPCSWWDLRPTSKTEGADTYRIDARAISPTLFPLAFNGETLDKPGISKPFEVPKSAMCAYAGADITVKSGKKTLFDERVIGHDGRVHTITLKPRGFTIDIDP